ncbi:hypothetical protein PIB30_069788 [Stylosanthes scabra]|uniref:Uncharacterized protein n=1 Tax=Stylosanthes scabra TaxID=79078 RepID=A0ABU6TN28_9FABA|nr:hypothetical protein [Stylosanthes scabra]
MEGTPFIHKFPIFDGNGDGYQWLILAEQFWNAQGTTEEQRFLEVEKGLAGKALAWFRLWKRDLDVALEKIRTYLEKHLPQPEKFNRSEDPITIPTHNFNTATHDREANGYGDCSEEDAVTAAPTENTQRKDIESDPPPLPTFSGDVVDDARSSTEVDASVERKGKAVLATEIRNATSPDLIPNNRYWNRAPNTEISKQQLHHRKANKLHWRVSPIVAKPHSLMAAAFPWNIDNEIHAKMPPVVKSIAVDGLRRDTIMDDSNTSVVNLAIVPILSSTKVIIDGTKGLSPSTEQHSQIESPSLNPVEGEAGALRNAIYIIDQDPNPNTAEQQLISQFNSKKNRLEFQSKTKLTGKRKKEENKAQLHEPSSVHGDITGRFETVSADEWSKLAGVVVLQRPPPELPDSVLLVKLTDARRLRSMDNDGGQDVGSRSADNGGGWFSVVTGGVSDYVGVLHGNAVAKEEGVIYLLEGGDNLQLGGDRGISNDTEINDVARENGDITVNEGSGWGQSGSKDDYSSGADPSLLLMRLRNASRLNRIRPFLGRPPKLLAAVLPWNRHSPDAESDDNEGGMPGVRKHEEQIEPDLKSYAVALGEPKTTAFMTETTPQWANNWHDGRCRCLVLGDVEQVPLLV